MVLTPLSLFLRLLGVPTTAYLLARSFRARLVRVGSEQPAIPLPRFIPVALAALKAAGVGAEQPSRLLPLSVVRPLRQLLDGSPAIPPNHTQASSPAALQIGRASC